MAFWIVRLPLMTSEGSWVPVEPSAWNTTLDKRGLLKLSSKNVGHVLSFGNLLAIEIGDEEQVTAVGKTLGRMALTGVGAALFSRGQGGGVGAGLLDLSFRGAEKKSVISGLMIFLDSSVMKFKVSAQEFDTIAKSVSEHVFSPEALQAASEMFDLLRRMKADGEKVLHEILSNLIEAKSQMPGLLTASEAGQSFADRDAARQELVSVEHNFQRERFLFTALLYDLGISPQQFFAKNSYPKEISEIIPSAGIDTEAASNEVASGRDSKGKEVSPWWGVVTVIIIILWIWHHFSR